MDSMTPELLRLKQPGSIDTNGGDLLGWEKIRNPADEPIPRRKARSSPIRHPLTG